ncbi:MAG: ATP-binding cassette domain-containing protein [Planctomycetota bacterium]
MSLLALEQVGLQYGARTLLRDVSFLIGERDRVGMVGANGAGKSTLLRILAGAEEPDSGNRTMRRGLQLGYLEQEPALDPTLSIRDVARQGLAGREATLAALDQVHQAMAEATDPDRLEALLKKQAALEDDLERRGGHDVEHRVESTLHGLGLPDPEARCGALSGGERRRTALARLLLSTPELLLLDEPTNHLDAEVIAWLEAFLADTTAALVLVTHDRYFLDRVVHRIVEIDRGALHDYAGNYGDFVLARADRLSREEKEESTRRNLLRRETEWMRRGPPARTTKSKARIDRYHQLVDAAPEAASDELSFVIPCAHRLGERVLLLDGVHHSYGERAVLHNVSVEIGRGERLGIVGANGAGKSTLLKICMGLLTPQQGSCTQGPTVKFSYIDQARSDLDPDRTVIEEVAGKNDHVVVDGRAVRIESYLQRFLFSPAAIRGRVGDLSGGERNRVLLAKLLSLGGNVLVLDEPTNDLDLMTLRVLEEALCAFAGAALIVSHDRWFLDRVATRILHLGPGGHARLHAGDLTGLLDKLAGEAVAAKTAAAPTKARSPGGKPAQARSKPRRMSSSDRNELHALPERIENAENAIGELDTKLADPTLYAPGTDGTEVSALTEQRERATAELQTLYARWEELEARAEAAKEPPADGG